MVDLPCDIRLYFAPDSHFSDSVGEMLECWNFTSHYAKEWK